MTNNINQTHAHTARQETENSTPSRTDYLVAIFKAYRMKDGEREQALSEIGLVDSSMGLVDHLAKKRYEQRQTIENPTLCDYQE